MKQDISFMKVELIEFSFNVSTDFTSNEVEELSYRFFHTLLPLSKMSPIVPAESDKGPLDIVTPMDWTLNGVEIGSYGVRQYKNLVKWVYGTGLAEPRFTTAKNYGNLQ
jgi:hypothetical protein